MFDLSTAKARKSERATGGGHSRSAAVLLLSLALLAGCATDRTSTAVGNRTLIGGISQPWCLFWCHITSTVTDGEAGATVKGATVTQSETVSASVNKSEEKK